MEKVTLPRFRYSTRLHQILFPDLICSAGDSDVHLTFDDGPHPVATARILNVLASRSVRATFFCTGGQVERYPGLVQRMRSDGHEVENHGYSHRGFLFRSASFIRSDIAAADRAIVQHTGRPTRFLRPPFGSFGPTTMTVARELGKRMVLWSFDARDFAVRDVDAFLRQVVSHVRPGSILLLHDNDSTEASIDMYLPRLVDELHGRGFSFAPVTA